MSLERKDVRFKLAPDLHQALTVLADVAALDIAEFVETIVVREVCKQVHAATLVAERTAALGLNGKARE